tara:strand:+ start:2045 stop:3082 length:1038 start_codon:yes stop_codon:yes gene_type:complete
MSSKSKSPTEKEMDEIIKNFAKQYALEIMNTPVSMIRKQITKAPKALNALKTPKKLNPKAEEWSPSEPEPEPDPDKHLFNIMDEATPTTSETARNYIQKLIDAVWNAFRTSYQYPTKDLNTVCLWYIFNLCDLLYLADGESTCVYTKALVPNKSPPKLVIQLLLLIKEIYNKYNKFDFVSINTLGTLFNLCNKKLIIFNERYVNRANTNPQYQECVNFIVPPLLIFQEEVHNIKTNIAAGNKTYWENYMKPLKVNINDSRMKDIYINYYDPSTSSWYLDPLPPITPWHHHLLTGGSKKKRTVTIKSEPMPKTVKGLKTRKKLLKKKIKDAEKKVKLNKNRVIRLK